MPELLSLPHVASGASDPASLNELVARLEEILRRLDTATAPRPLAVEKDVLGAMLGCSERHIDRMVSAGEIPKPVKLGTQKTVWVLATVEAWLAAENPSILIATETQSQ